MDPLDRIDKRGLRDLMSRCWMTHDAMWFLHSAREIGIEKTNRINKAAVRSMAALEVKRLKKALGYGDKKLESSSELKKLFEEMFGVIKADFMQGTIDFPGENVMRLAWQQCFAYDGVNKMGVIDQYQCGIFDRIEGWFEGLAIKYEVSPRVEGCMMHKEGKCYRDFKVIWE